MIPAVYESQHCGMPHSIWQREDGAQTVTDIHNSPTSTTSINLVPVNSLQYSLWLHNVAPLDKPLDTSFLAEHIDTRFRLMAPYGCCNLQASCA